MCTNVRFNQCRYINMNTSYPITNEASNSLLKRVIKTILASNNFYNYYRSVSPRNSKVDINNVQEEWCLPQLIFPSDIPDFCHLPELTRHSFIVAGFSTYRGGSGESGLADEDDPELRIIIVAEGERAFSEDGVDYCEYEFHGTLPLPHFDYDAEALKDAVNEVILLTKSLSADNAQQWTTRLHLALDLLSSNGRPLKILETMGLYDFEALRSMIVQKYGTDNSVAIQAIHNLEHHLYLYTMTCINRTPNSVSSDTKEEKSILPTGSKHSEAWISNIKTQRPEEYKWLKYIHCPSLPDHITEPTYISDLLPENWPDDIEAMHQYLQWTESDEANLKSSLGNTTNDAYMEPIRQLVRKKLRKEAVKEFNNKKMEWMVLYNR